jgi:hypothetical protein
VVEVLICQEIEASEIKRKSYIRKSGIGRPKRAGREIKPTVEGYPNAH